MRTLAVVAALALGAAACGRDPALIVRYIGHSAFEITDGATTLLVDFPYESGVDGYMAYDPASVRPAGRVVALFTHAHRDHFSLEPLLREDWQVAGPEDVTRRLPPGRVLSIADTLRIGAFHVVAVPEWHADVGHLAYVVRWRGRSLYHSGDALDPANLQAMRGLDVAMVGEGMLCWMAQQRGARVDARHLVAHHFFAGSARGCLGARVMGQGEELRLETAS